MPTFSGVNVNNSMTVPFYAPFAAGAWLGAAGSVVAGVTEKALTPTPCLAADDTSNGCFQFVVPWPCVLEEVAITFLAADNSDIMYIKVKRGVNATYPVAARATFAAAVEQISNSITGSGAAIDYINCTTATTLLTDFIRYKGVPQVAGSAATGFVKTATGPTDRNTEITETLSTPTVWNAGDSLFVSGDCADASDSFGEVIVYVTLSRVDG